VEEEIKPRSLPDGTIIILGLEKFCKRQQKTNTNPSTWMDKATHSSFHNTSGP